jgi:integrase
MDISSGNKISPFNPPEEFTARPVGRSRYQRGSLGIRGKRPVWVGRWREDIRLPDGTPKRIVKTTVLGYVKDFPTKKSALRLLDRKMATVNLPNASVRYRVTFGQFATSWKERSMSSFKPSSVQSVSGHINNWLIPHFGEMILSEITPQDVQLFLLKITLTPKTVRNIVSTIRMVWKTARQWKLTDTNVLDGVRCPRLNPPHQPRFTVEQVKQIISLAKEPAKTLFYIAAETGMRAGELLGLRKQDIETENRCIHIRQAIWNGHISTPKSASAVRQMAISVHLTEHLDGFLRERFRDNPNSLLFVTQTGQPIDFRWMLRGNLHPILKKLELPFHRVGIHAFRHTNASIMDRQRIPLRVRTDRLGHSDPSTTIKIYTHQLDREADLAIADQLGEILCPECPSCSTAQMSFTFGNEDESS